MAINLIDAVVEYINATTNLENMTREYNAAVIADPDPHRMDLRKLAVEAAALKLELAQYKIWCAGERRPSTVIPKHHADMEILMTPSEKQEVQNLNDAIELYTRTASKKSTGMDTLDYQIIGYMRTAIARIECGVAA